MRPPNVFRYVVSSGRAVQYFKLHYPGEIREKSRVKCAGFRIGL